MRMPSLRHTYTQTLKCECHEVILLLWLWLSTSALLLPTWSLSKGRQNKRIKKSGGMKYGNNIRKDRNVWMNKRQPNSLQKCGVSLQNSHPAQALKRGWASLLNSSSPSISVSHYTLQKMAAELISWWDVTMFSGDLCLSAVETFKNLFKVQVCCQSPPCFAQTVYIVSWSRIRRNYMCLNPRFKRLLWCTGLWISVNQIKNLKDNCLTRAS